MKEKALKFLNDLVNDDTSKGQLDIIAYIKKCIKEYERSQESNDKFDWGFIFDKLWEIYPRKVGKEAAKKAFEHKVRGLPEEDCRAKCNVIYIREKQAISGWVEDGTETQYIPHFSTWLNANVPNSDKYRGR